MVNIGRTYICRYMWTNVYDAANKQMQTFLTKTIMCNGRTNKTNTNVGTEARTDQGPKYDLRRNRETPHEYEIEIINVHYTIGAAGSPKPSLVTTMTVMGAMTLMTRMMIIMMMMATTTAMRHFCRPARWLIRITELSQFCYCDTI